MKTTQDRLRFLLKLSRKPTHLLKRAKEPTSRHLLAKFLGTTTHNIDTWLSPSGTPSKKYLTEIAEFFECDETWFREGIGIPFRRGRPEWMSDLDADVLRSEGLLQDLDEEADKIDRLRMSLDLDPEFIREIHMNPSQYYETLRTPALRGRALNKILNSAGIDDDLIAEMVQALDSERGQASKASHQSQAKAQESGQHKRAPSASRNR